VNAAVIPAVGAPLRIEELRHPEPKAGEARIRVAACGICHSDLHVARGHLKFPMPCVPESIESVSTCVPAESDRFGALSVVQVCHPPVLGIAIEPVAFTPSTLM